MKKITMVKSIIKLSILSLILTSCSIKQVQYNKRTVSVYGTGTVQLEADIAEITLSVITKAKTADVSAAQNADKMTKVQDAIFEAGVPKSAITTINYNVFQETNYINNRSIPGEYRATNTIRIEINDVSLISKVLDEAVKNGATDISSIDYSISSTEVAVKQARTLAVQQAQEAALLIAGTSGAKLGAVLNIEEETSAPYPRNLKAGRYTLEAVALKDSSTPVQIGKETISVTVHATYELQ